MDALGWHRLQFAFTIVFHYLFPVITMGLAFLVVVLKAVALRRPGTAWDDAARLAIRLFGISFVFGVVTGFPVEFQFGTNWARFSRYSGGVVGQTLALESLFAFFFESSVLGLLVFQERRLGPRRHFLAAVALFAGSWASAFFVIVGNAFMQRPVGYALGADGTLQVGDWLAIFGSRWAWIEFAHNQCSVVVAGSFVLASIGAFYALRGVHLAVARVFLRVGAIAGFVASVLVAFPTGALHGKLVARHQPVTLAAMEGRFESGPRAPLHMIGQPNVAARRLDNPVALPALLSMLAFGSPHAEVRGLDAFPAPDWPDQIELLYYAFHVMAGLGTLFLALTLAAALLEWRGRLVTTPAMLWALLLALPFPFIAILAGWLTAELGRQPWLVYGLFRTGEGASPVVHSGTVLFTLIGTCGVYSVLGLLFLFFTGREIARGPHPRGEAPHG